MYVLLGKKPAYALVQLLIQPLINMKSSLPTSSSDEAHKKEDR